MTATINEPDASTAAASAPAAAREGGRSVRGSLVVFSDDWGRHPSSCQHIVQHLLADYEVLWVNTIGTRGPRLDLATIRRAAGKFLARPPAPARDANDASRRPRVLNPLMWPWFRTSFDRRINRTAILRALKQPVAALPRPCVAVTTIPLVADLVGHLAVDRWVYYCVDDLAAWPGLESGPLQAMERELVAKVDAAISVSDVLQQRLNSIGCNSTVVSHGVDLRHWQQPQANATVSESLLAAPHPWVVFWGLIDERLDAEWLRKLADAMTQGSLVIAGPAVCRDHRLLHHPRIAFPGAFPYAELPALAQQAAVLVMPYRPMPATEAMQPLKLKEYLGTGLPCVVRRLPATMAWQDCADLADTSDEFVTTVLARLQSGLPASQQEARSRLATESWAAKAQEFEASLQAALGAPGSRKTE